MEEDKPSSKKEEANQSDKQSDATNKAPTDRPDQAREGADNPEEDKKVSDASDLAEKAFVDSKATAYGINWVVAAMFILGELVGGGVVAMPAGFVHTGVVMGVVFMIVICSIFTFTGWMLADSWSLMRKRYPEYRRHCRTPYPDMGLRSMGKCSEILTKIFVNFSLAGTGIVYLLLSAQVFHNVLGYANLKFNFCYVVIIVAVGILPTTFLKSPADYWQAIVVAVFCTVVAIVLIFIGLSIDLPDCYPHARYTKASFNSIYSLGIFLFAFNGHQVFPTVQNDMRHPDEFKKSVILGFMLVALLYVPLSIYSFIVYGDSMHNSVIESVQTTWIRYVADLSIAMHCILTIIITVNPVNLQFEDMFNVPHKFCMQRVIVRTSLMTFMLIVALSIPNFTSVMDLFGSTTIPITCIILPSLFNVYLRAAVYDRETRDYPVPTVNQVIDRTSREMIATVIAINVITIICSCISTYMAIQAILTVSFTPPCFMLPFVSNYKDIYQQDVVNCCGFNSSIARYSGIKCSVRVTH